jgi:zinc protease
MRRLLIACLFFLAFCAVSSAAEPKKVASVEGITEYQLDNGLRALLYPEQSRPKVTVCMTVMVGSRHEGYGESGMAHLLEHMVFKGTPDHPLIPKALQEHGAQFNGTTNFDRTNYFETLNATDDNLEFALRMEADRLVNSLVKREDLLSEMTVVRNEFERGENSVNSVLNKRIWATAFEWHNYGKTTIGNRADIERVPIESLQAFYRKYYQPDNTMVVVAGKFDESKALELLQKYFGSIPRPKRELPTTYTEEPEQDGERVVTVRRVGNVSQVGVAWHIPAGPHPDTPAMDVLANLLSDVPSGPLYKALVETKKATNVSTFAATPHDPGLFMGQAEVPQVDQLEEVKETLISIIEQVGEKGVSDEAVQRAKRQIQKDNDQEAADTQRFAISLSNWASMGDWRLYFLYRDAIEKVTADQVKSVAAKYFKQSNRTVGLYVPTTSPERVRVPSTPDVEEIVKNYKGKEGIAAGEAFDFSPQGIEKRTKRIEIVPGAQAALVPKKTRGNEVFVELSLHYGNDQNLKGMTTAAAILPQLMLRGTKKLSEQQFKDELDRLQATLRASSNRGQISFSLQTKRDSLPEALGLLRQALREPLLGAEQFEIIRQQRIAQAERAKTEPQGLAMQNLLRTLAPYPEDDVRYTPTYEEQIARHKELTLEQLQTLYRDFLGVAQAEIAIVGDFDPEACVPVLKQALTDWQPKQSYARIEMKVGKQAAGGKQEIDTPDKANAVYTAGLLIPLSDADPDYPALTLGDFILGAGSLSSRLGDRVRQKEGLSYGVRSQFHASAKDEYAYLMLQAICNPQNLGKLEGVMQEEFELLVNKGVTAKEVEQAKQGLLQSRQVGRSNDEALADKLAELLYQERTMVFDEGLEKEIAKLTPDDVNAALKKHLDPKRLVVVTAGDRKAAASAAGK